MKHILVPNNKEYFLALTVVPTTNYPLYLRKKEINFSSRFNQFTENESLVRYRPSFNEIEELMEYRQSPDRDAGMKEVTNIEAIIQVVRKNKKYYSSKSIGVWVATLSIILIVVLTAIIRHIKTNEAKQVYDTFFTIPAPIPVKGQASISFPAEWDNAVALYKTGNFSHAIDKFTTAAIVSHNPDVAIFYKGICFMALNQFSKALETFEMISNSSDIFFQTKYYSGLCNIQLNRIDAARVVFSQLISSEEWAKNAKEILLKLESID